MAPEIRMCNKCGEHPRRKSGTDCLKCRALYEKLLRRSKKPQQWPCRQCWGPIRWVDGRGGNRKRICDECAPNERYRSLVQRYGVDKAMFEAMYFEQNGKCALEPCTREAVAVDHCHETGKVRGLLCKGCNVAVGFLEWRGWLDSAHEYLDSKNLESADV
ncbi:endonuclease VII [Streptomyces phage Ibantik]|uniref:Endonuclease VII n=1 Tax=Streptomyces phage Ibantik TaxID=2182397 RepID=A0A2U8UNH4_9CAUD|nr:endonuclease VII [Streptomyces phage Ibantik]AWN05284.1 endonuclease VII [Streptomyces phage Ibantik]